MKKIHVYGGGTFSHVRTHLALATFARGTTAKKITELIDNDERFDNMELQQHLTVMGDPESKLVTNDDVFEHVKQIREDLETKIVIFNVALCDYSGTVLPKDNKAHVASGKYAETLKTSEGMQNMLLVPEEKIIKHIRSKGRKDIFLVAFKTTSGASEKDQYLAGLKLMKDNSCNLVLANDVVTRKNMIITPEEATYHITTDRDEALRQLVDMIFYRSQLTFTRSTVVEGQPVAWDSPLVFPALRNIVNYCIDQNAYKPFNGATVGHFACKIGEREFLTSIRKSNFNELKTKGLVRVVTDGDDSVLAYGAKPSVGGQSQRIVFSDHPDYDCIVHFHCPIKPGSDVPVVSQREYECGSHQCGQNTSRGLKKYGNLSAVMLDNHGPNIVFNHNIDPQEVIDFINANFDLQGKTGGLVS